MTTRLNPYLGFRDTTKEAMTYYQSVFGGELTLSTFRDFNASQDEAELDKIMHGMLATEEGMILMAADTPSSMDYNPGNTFSISLSGEDENELQGYWDRLAGDGTVTVPLEAAPWGDRFGMCTDKFGVAWLINIAGAPPQQ